MNASPVRLSAHTLFELMFDAKKIHRRDAEDEPNDEG
jgi:hypothetical protein